MEHAIFGLSFVLGRSGEGVFSSTLHSGQDFVVKNNLHIDIK